MKNHIKNYIKIMGLAAVPLGTAQVHGTEYKIEVKKKETDEVRHFSIGVKCFSKERCLLKPEVIEIDWAKRNDAVPVRVSKHDAKSIFRFCDVMMKDNAALYYENKKLVRGTVHVLSFWVRQLPSRANEPFREGLRCDLILNPNPGANQEEVLLAMKGYKDYIVVSVLSDIPTFLRGDVSFFFMTNYLCSSDKLPLFFISSNNRFFFRARERYVFVNDSLPMTDKEMRKSFRECEHAVVIEGGHIICVVEEGRLIGREEFQKEHSDHFEVRDAFSSDLIKDGKVYVSHDLEIEGIVLLKIHNDTDGVISYAGELFIEPHGMISFSRDYFCGQGLFDVKKKASDDWGTKVWIECPNGKSPKIYNFFKEQQIADKKRKQRMLQLMGHGVSADEKEILKALREKDPKDWIKTILNFGKKINAIGENEIKIEDKKEEPKVEEEIPLRKKKAPKKIEKNEIIMKENEDPFGKDL